MCSVAPMLVSFGMKRTGVVTRRAFSSILINSPLKLFNNNQINYPKNIIKRSIIRVLDPEDPINDTYEDADWDDFANDTDIAGADDNPYHRKEHRKKKEMRLIMASKKQAKFSNEKVQALVDFVEFKRERKYK
jgi:hypothetical protein